MASEYSRIFATAAEDPGTAGDQGEENWATLLREWLPPEYHIETKGRLIGHNGVMSPQIDLVVLKPSYPRKLLTKKVWMAGGVAAAFECKTTLNAAHIKDAVKKCILFKSLFPERKGSPLLELRSPLTYGILAHSHAWKGKQSDPIGNVEKAFAEKQDTVIHPRFEIDLICVSDLAVWHSIYMSTYISDQSSPQKAQLEKLFGGPVGPATAMSRAALNDDRQAQTFRPFGALLSILTRRLGWDNGSVRALADYYLKVNLEGSGQGGMRFWPASVYSEEVRSQTLGGRFTNGVFWDEWSIAGY